MRWSLLSAVFLLAAPAAVAADFNEIDRLYFNRHQSDNLTRSNEMLESMLRDDPDAAAALWRLARGLVRLGERQERKKDRIRVFKLAQAKAERSTQIVPSDAEAHFWVGLALGRHGQSRGILRSLFMVKPMKKRMRRVIELDAKHGGAHHVLGQMYRQLPRIFGGSKESAVRELLTALRLTPDFTAHYPALAEAYLDLGEKGKAHQVLKAFYKVKTPSDPAVYAGHKEKVSRMLNEIGVSSRPAAAPRE